MEEKKQFVRKQTIRDRVSPFKNTNISGKAPSSHLVLEKMESLFGSDLNSSVDSDGSNEGGMNQLLNRSLNKKDVLKGVI